MQTFQIRADSTVSMSTQAAIDRKSCDYCFSNRKTCSHVKQSTRLEDGEKCKICEKENRACTFTPTAHLFTIAECVGLQQCRAKVQQAMGGKKSSKMRILQIPLVCNLDSSEDMRIYDALVKQPNLLLVSNQIKSIISKEVQKLFAPLYVHVRAISRSITIILTLSCRHFLQIIPNLPVSPSPLLSSSSSVSSPMITTSNNPIAVEDSPNPYMEEFPIIDCRPNAMIAKRKRDSLDL
jgi:hypothetical protein